MSEPGSEHVSANGRVLDITGVKRTFHQGRDDLHVLRGIDLALG